LMVEWNGTLVKRILRVGAHCISITVARLPVDPSRSRLPGGDLSRGRHK
jgi:hypothetical protein